LKRRGIPAQVVTVGLGANDGRDDFIGIPFLSLPTLAEIGEPDSTIVFVNFQLELRPGGEPVPAGDRALGCGQHDRAATRCRTRLGRLPDRGTGSWPRRFGGGRHAFGRLVTC
ncbi:MAG TPA: hypothetical protein VKV33_11035, partial [Streptosporangiaceae bacterium]|nr:hypothetical protein [Streptosporangiaceae bacterium]